MVLTTSVPVRERAGAGAQARGCARARVPVRESWSARRRVRDARVRRAAGAEQRSRARGGVFPRRAQRAFAWRGKFAATCSGRASTALGKTAGAKRRRVGAHRGKHESGARRSDFTGRGCT